jgi:phosphatidylglycerol lysyltransferase
MTQWTLDLMRHAPDMPDGTMQALVTHAILVAQAAGVAQLSLAAAPLPSLRENGEDAGLARFKQGFAPRWQSLYLVAPGAVSLAITLAEIARAIHAPPPLRRGPALRAVQDDHAEYGIAPGTRAWHTGA